MQDKYEHKKIEEKWQEKWEKEQPWKVTEDADKQKFYGLIEFPYPSGAGLHVGHVRSNTAMDIICRKRRSEGYNVLYPIGWDAFGLPTENYAIKTGIHPREVTKQNTDTFRRQLKKIGFSFDWSREVDTTDPSYYKWTQWIFLKLYEKGLAYKAKIPINWCLSCKIGLANEEVVDGVCERCGGEVEKRDKEQWMLAITKYAERLDKDLDDVDFLDKIKIQQRNWIGKSEGAEIEFAIKNSGEITKVFTTRPDTLFGATYMVLAPEHKLVEKLLGDVKNKDEVESYIKETSKKKDIDRTAEGREKTGVRLEGVVAINPALSKSGKTKNAEIPIFIADYVLAHYGTGAIMAVPAHDERDFEFATKFNLPIKQVIRKVFGEPLPNPIPRIAVGAIVYNPKTKKYLVQYSNDFKKHSFIFGGLEDGEDYAQAAIRETLEETGYKTKFVQYITEETESHFYHPGKKINRLLLSRRVLLELIDDKQEPVSEEELKKQIPVWLSKSELRKKLTASEEAYALDMLFDKSTYTGSGNLINSDKFDGLDSEEAKASITKFVEGEIKTTFKLRDWVFSRQRYWGEPIPMVHCEKCGIVPLPETELPLELPDVEKYEPTNTGESPLAAIDDWVNTTCPKCGGEAKRETDTMPNWAGSSWYFLRYSDPHNAKELASKEALKYWTPISWYNGGMEHTTLHLLYSRFWHKFLFDIGVVPTHEPYAKRTSHGMILAEDGKKMSKSLGNVINPDDVIESVGADALRVYEMFMGPFDQPIAWSTKSMQGARKWLDKIWRLQSKTQANNVLTVEAELHKTIKKVTEDIENMKFNTAISQMMIFINLAEKEGIGENQYKIFLQLLAPFAPHITAELSTDVHEQKWPTYDESKLMEDIATLAVQVNGKVRAELEMPIDSEEEEVKAQALKLPQVTKWLENAEPRKVIVVPNRIVNIVI